jgi:3-hydroxybutyryl-CoA dehydrogenase
MEDFGMKTIGVVGCGLMGSGVAQVCAQAGYKTLVSEVSEELLGKGQARIGKSLEKMVEKGKQTREEMAATLANLSGTTRLEDLAGCDLVIEAVVENVDEKKRVFAELDRITGPETLLATNTSSVCVIELAAATGRPDKVLGLHFFNPVPVMKLVEVVKTIATADATVAKGHEFVRSLGKEPITCPDTTAFVVNKLLVPYLLDAVRMLEAGQVTREDIDKAMQLGCGYPMGPLTLLDFVGIDTTYYIANIMFDEFKDARYAAPPLMKRMVLAGHLGKKSGRGFYDYSR